jgi:hypothetical protein
MNPDLGKQRYLAQIFFIGGRSSAVSSWVDALANHDGLSLWTI